LESERDASTKFPEGIVIHMLRDGIDAFGDPLHVSMDHIHAIAHGMNAILG